jgi:ribosomal protein L32
MLRFKFKVTLKCGTILRPKGFYYQGKKVILVGCEETGHTIRRSELCEDVKIEIID